MHFFKSAALSALAIVSCTEQRVIAASSQKTVKAVIEMTQEQAFMALLERGDRAGLEQLIDAGFDVNALLENGASPLVMAIFSASVIGSAALDIAHLLIEKGARTDVAVTIGDQTVTPAQLIDLLQQELAAFAQTPELSPEQHSGIEEVARTLSMIKKRITRA